MVWHLKKPKKTSRKKIEREESISLYTIDWYHNWRQALTWLRLRIKIFNQFCVSIVTRRSEKELRSVAERVFNIVYWLCIAKDIFDQEMDGVTQIIPSKKRKHLQWLKLQNSFNEEFHCDGKRSIDQRRKSAPGGSSVAHNPIQRLKSQNLVDLELLHERQTLIRMVQSMSL